jgi:cytochrome P450
MASALDGSTASQVTHAVGTVSNGFGALLPVLAVSLAEVAQRPWVIAACQRGERTWMSVAEQLLRLRTIFPVAVPRVVLADTQLSGRLVTRGTVVLPSLIAAAHDLSRPAPCNIAFGAGPHFCPGAALTRLWLACAMAGFFEVFPQARLAGPLEWQPGTLSVPREIVLALR